MPIKISNAVVQTTVNISNDMPISIYALIKALISYPDIGKEPAWLYIIHAELFIGCALCHIAVNQGHLLPQH